MPKNTWTGWSYASEEELLAFANKVREAGGANVLDALMPSDPNEPSSCLIANALNFGCEVTPDESKGKYADGSHHWVMLIGGGDDKVREIATKLHMRVVKYAEKVYVNGSEITKPTVLALSLPKRIGNAADAFDREEGWTRKYNKELIPDDEW